MECITCTRSNFSE